MCQALRLSSFGIPNETGLVIAALSVIVGHAESRKKHSRGNTEVLINEGGEDGDDPIGCPGNSAGPDGAQAPPYGR